MKNRLIVHGTLTCTSIFVILDILEMWCSSCNTVQLWALLVCLTLWVSIKWSRMAAKTPLSFQNDGVLLENLQLQIWKIMKVVEKSTHVNTQMLWKVKSAPYSWREVDLIPESSQQECLRQWACSDPVESDYSVTGYNNTQEPLCCDWTCVK